MTPRLQNSYGRVRAALRPHTAVFAGLLLGVLAHSGAQAQGSRSGGFSSSLETSLAYVETRSAPQDNGHDLSLLLRPTLGYASRSGRVRGSGNYSLGLVNHTRDSQPSEVLHDLSARFTAEAVENWLFIDGTATAARSALSAFGSQSAAGSFQRNDNSTEVASVSLSPYLRGSLTDWAQYEARVDARATNTRRSKVGDSTSTGSQVSLNSPSRGALLGWGLLASRDHASFRTQRSIDNERVQASLLIAPGPEIRFTLRGGQESTTASSLQRRRTTNTGVDAQWTPNERTQASLSSDKRYFGRSHQVRFSHRLPQSTLSFGSSKSASTSSDPNSLGRPITQFDLANAIFQSAIADAAEREQFVLNLLRAQGVDPAAIVPGGFVNAGATLQRRTDLAWSYSGRRLGLTVQAYMSQSSALTVGDEAPAESATRQKGYTGTVSYRLTPTASAVLTGQRLMTRASSAQPGTDLKSLALSWSDQIGWRTSLSLGLRYSVFNSLTEPYRESSATASLTMRF